MSEKEYLNYQICIKNYIENESKQFSCEYFANVICSKVVEILNNKKLKL